MKIKFTPEAKKLITVAELPYVRKIIEDMKEDGCIKQYAIMVANIANKYGASWEILKAEAEIGKNPRIHDCFAEGSGSLDVYIKIYAYNSYYGFYDIGVFLSDIWQIGSGNSDEIRRHMDIKEYKDR